MLAAVSRFWNFGKLEMLDAVVFDMDGLLIDSQPFWQTAQLEVLTALGVPITRQDTIDTTGMHIDQIVQMCYAKFPWTEISCEQVCEQIVDRVIELVREHKPAMPGLWHAIQACQQQGLRLGLASSSPLSLIHATVQTLQLEDIFDAQLSGDKLRYAKPHPEVYLNACEALQAPPEKCLAIEDSFVGLLAAKSAQMKTSIIPELAVAAQPQFVIADRQLASLEQLTPQLLQTL